MKDLRRLRYLSDEELALKYVDLINQAKDKLIKSDKKPVSDPEIITDIKLKDLTVIITAKWKNSDEEEVASLQVNPFDIVKEISINDVKKYNNIRLNTSFKKIFFPALFSIVCMILQFYIGLVFFILTLIAFFSIYQTTKPYRLFAGHIVNRDEEAICPACGEKLGLGVTRCWKCDKDLLLLIRKKNRVCMPFPG